MVSQIKTSPSSAFFTPVNNLIRDLVIVDWLVARRGDFQWLRHVRLHPRDVKMNRSDHQDYYVARAEVARTMSLRAADPGVAAIHAQFAIRYDALAADSETMDYGNRPGAQAT